MMKDSKEKATMKVVNTKESKEQSKKYTYEELEQICAKVVEDNRNMVAQLRRMQQNYLFQRIDFLLKIIGLADKFNDAEFINTCVDEVKTAMIIPEEETKEEEKKKEG